MFVFFIDPTIPGGRELAREITLLFEEVNQAGIDIPKTRIFDIHAIVEDFNNNVKKFREAREKINLFRKDIGLSSH